MQDGKAVICLSENFFLTHAVVHSIMVFAKKNIIVCKILLKTVTEFNCFFWQNVQQSKKNLHKHGEHTVLLFPGARTHFRGSKCFVFCD